LAIGLPASIGMRVLMALHNAVSRPTVITVVQLIGLALKLPLNLLSHFMEASVLQAWADPGCAVATVIINWSWLLMTLGFVLYDRFYRPFQIFAHFSMPDWHRIWTLLKLGTPIGFSYLIEVTSFTFMSLFIARLGTTALAGHQIVANMGTVIYGSALIVDCNHDFGVSIHWRRPTRARRRNWLVISALHY
jgi:MATE family multidrug resistance protein